jgi:hypothetical protein
MGKHGGNRNRNRKNKQTTTFSKESSPLEEQNNIVPSNCNTNETIEPEIYSEDCRRVEDYGEFVKVIGNLPDYVLEGVLYTKPKEGCITYVPPVPFLGKYKQLYYELDEVTENLLACFVDW